MKLIVTGGLGFIGSHLVRYLLQQGISVINIDKITYAADTDNLLEVTQHPKYKFYKIDICDKEGIYQVIHDAQPDGIIHLAAESHVDRSIDCADEFIQTNIVGTYTILNSAFHYWCSLIGIRKEQFRFVHVSTDEVFGALSVDGKFNENSAYHPNSPYAASKASSDMLVYSYYRTFRFPIIISNCSNNYGPCQYPEKLIPLMIANALAGKPLPLYGNGQQIRDWLYVDDHVHALWLLLQKGKIGEQYCIGGDNEYVNQHLVEKICDLLDGFLPMKHGKSYRELISFVSDRPGHDFRYASDASKLKEHTGWTAKVNFDEGLYTTVKWYLEKFKGTGILSSKRIGMGLLHEM